MSEPQRFVDAGLLNQLLERVTGTLTQVDTNVAQATNTLEQLKIQRNSLNGQRSLLTDLIKAAKEISTEK